MQLRNYCILKESYVTDKGSCFYTVYDGLSNIKSSLDVHVQLFANYYDRVINIESIEVKDENQGFGSEILQHVLQVTSGTPVILMAGFLTMRDYIEASTNPRFKDEFFKRLIHFYRKNGFIEINDYISCYTNYSIMLRSNGSNFSF